MRRAISVLLAAGLILTMAAPVAAHGGKGGAAKPEVIPLEPVYISPEELEGTCDFPVELQDTKATGNLRVWPVDKKGDQRDNVLGGYTSVVTNLATGKKITITYHGMLDLIYRANGTIDITTVGRTLWFDYGSDPNWRPGAGIWLHTGVLVGRTDADFNFLKPPKVVGKFFDVCRALS